MQTNAAENGEIVRKRMNRERNEESSMSKTRLPRLWALLLALCLAAPGACAADGAPAAMTLLAVNVGKADCLILRYGDLTYMIDTGTRESWGAVSAALRTGGITRLDGVILTHTDKDHAGGLPALAASWVEVDAWYASAFFCEVTEEDHPAVLAAAQRGQRVDKVQQRPFLVVIEELSIRQAKLNTNGFISDLRIKGQLLELWLQSKGIDLGVANSLLVKVNQIGTLSETLDAVDLAHR